MAASAMDKLEKQTTCFQCPYCTGCPECIEFQKVAELKDAGLVIYRHTLHLQEPPANEIPAQIEVEAASDVVSPGKNIKPRSDSNVDENSKDVFILQNIRDVEITSADFMPEFERKLVSCQRCQQMMARAQVLMGSVAALDRKDVKAVCDHCKTKQFLGTCFICDKIVKKFMNARSKLGEEHEKTKRRFQVFLGKMQTLLQTTLETEKKPERGKSYSDEELHKLIQKKERDVPRLPDVDQLLFQGEGPRTIKATDIAPSYYSDENQALRIEKTSKGKVKIQQTHEVFKDLPTEYGDRDSLTLSELQEIRERGLPTDSAEVLLPPEHKIQESEDKKRKVKPNLSKPHRDETGVVPPRIRKYHSEESLITSFSAITEEILKKHLKYFFPQTQREKKKTVISSTELISKTHHRLSIEADEKKKKLEEERQLKMEEEQRKRQAREEAKKRKAEEEAERKAKEVKMKAEEEAKRAAEENVKKAKGRYLKVPSDETDDVDEKIGKKAKKDKIRSGAPSSGESGSEIEEKAIKKQKGQSASSEFAVISKPLKEKKSAAESDEKKSKIKDKQLKDDFETSQRPRVAKGVKEKEEKVLREKKEEKVEKVVREKKEEKVVREKKEEKVVREKKEERVEKVVREKKEEKVEKPKLLKPAISKTMASKSEKKDITYDKKAKELEPEKKGKDIEAENKKKEEAENKRREAAEIEKRAKEAVDANKKSKDAAETEQKDKDAEKKAKDAVKKAREASEAIAKRKESETDKKAKAAADAKGVKESAEAEKKQSPDKITKEAAESKRKQVKESAEAEKKQSPDKITKEAAESKRKQSDADRKSKEADTAKKGKEIAEAAKKGKEAAEAHIKAKQSAEADKAAKAVADAAAAADAQKAKESAEADKKALAAESGKKGKGQSGEPKTKGSPDVTKKIAVSQKGPEKEKLKKVPEKEIGKKASAEIVKKDVQGKGVLDKKEVELLNKALASQEKLRVGQEQTRKAKEEQLKIAQETAEKRLNTGADAKPFKPAVATVKEKPPPIETVKEDKSKQQSKNEPKMPEVDANTIKPVNKSEDDLILRLVKVKRDENPAPKPPLPVQALPEIPIKIKTRKKKPATPVNALSEISLDLESLLRRKLKSEEVDVDEIIIGNEICLREAVHVKPPPEIMPPTLFKTAFVPTAGVHDDGETKLDDDNIAAKTNLPKVGKEVGTSKGIVRYALSDRTFIEKGWTMLPTEKVVRKMNVYRMRPSQPEFDWFEHNKSKGVMTYDSGEKLADFDDNGRGRWYYRNGKIALDYYDCEEMNAQQRFIVYSSGEPDERGRSHPISVLGMFDYLGNGVVFDHSGKIRLKYNQSEGVVLDRGIGPVSHWKWHSLNDPPILQQVMIDTHVAFKDPDIIKLGGPEDDKTRPDNEEMLAIEFDNFIKEKSMKSTQKFKPFQIRMKALKINENFSLRVLDQATIYLLFRDGTTNLKLNLGMILDHQEIVDTETAELGEVSNNLERLPGKTDSLRELQNYISNAKRFDRVRTELNKRLHPVIPTVSIDKLKAPTSQPLRPLRTVPSNCSTSNVGSYKCRKPPTNVLYYDTRLV